MPPMQDLLRDYLPIVIFMAIAAGLAIALMASAFIIAVRNPDPEKLSAECGFNLFDDARMKFDVRFYLVFALHVFDLEVASCFLGGHSQGDRCLRLLVDDGVSRRADHRLSYEWRKGALEWD